MLSRFECLKEYGSDYYIKQKVDSGELFLLEKGIYSYKKDVPEIALVSFKYPKAVFTLDTAFYLYLEMMCCNEKLDKTQRKKS